MKKRKFNYLNILSIIAIIIFVIVTYFVFRLNILTKKMLILVIGIILTINLVAIGLVNLKNKIFKIIGIIIMIIIIIGSSIGSYYLSNTNSFLDNSFNNNEIVYTNTFYVVTNNDNNYDKSNIKDEISYYKDTTDIDDALNYLKKNYKIKDKLYEDIGNMFYDLKNNNIKFMLVEKSSYDIVFNLDSSLNKGDFKVIDQFDIKKKKENKPSSIKDSFNIYIGGNDFTNSLMDFNMIVSVNMKKHQILLTSIPRDYYVEVAGKDGRRDTLSYMGPYGIETSVSSLENLFGIEIDYYVKVNTESLVELVDKIGGITYCSDIAFTTTHALVLNTYNDYGKKLYVKKGCQELNGIETLTVARERMAFPGRDRVRQENCRKIIIAIFEKLKSTNTILIYNQMLDSLSNMYVTTIPREIISNFAKETLNGAKWQILEQSVNGSDGIDYVHLTNLKDWVMYPDMNTVVNAKGKIEEVLK